MALSSSQILRSLTRLLLALAVLLSGCAGSPDRPPQPNLLTAAVAWKQTAAEYEALYHQAFNLARLHVDTALAARQDGDRPLAVIVDLDDTLLDTRDYWAELLAADKAFFDDADWDAWIPQNRVRPTPGALAFLNHCAANQVEVFYVTNRNQGPETYEMAMAHLRVNQMPYADADHLTVLTESSNKQVRQTEIAKTHDVVLLMGDNLNDFSRDYYVSNVEERKAVMQRDQALFGTRYILLPNPTDGHWVRALFGDSEPAPSAANLSRWREAAIKGE